MQRVHCPHCSTELTNDGSLAGQHATCAACGGLFEMPALVRVTAVQERRPEPEPDHEPEYESDLDDLPRRKKRESGGGGAFVAFTVMALVVVPLIILVVGLIVITGDSFRGKAPPGAPAPAHPKKKTGR